MSNDYGAPSIIYLLADCAEQRLLDPWDACPS